MDARLHVRRKKMQKRMNGLWFRLMALEYRMKSRSVLQALEDAGIKPGMSILDFGCGPGRYSLPAARLVGSAGMVYAADVHPLAIRMVARGAQAHGLTNLRTVLTDCATGLPAGSVDVVLLFDALHDIEDRTAVLKELRRVLKEGGRIQYQDHTLFGGELHSLMMSGGFCVQEGSKPQVAFRKC
jgi:ubiquinone/menaquinone biosynthesis C-methylase UbiE